MTRYYYSNAISVFLQQSQNEIIGELAQGNEFSLELTQRAAWIKQIELLKNVLSLYNGYLFFEYSIPRIGKRIDVVILIKGIIFVLEFKVGEKKYLTTDIDQVWDYALDLKNFHEASHSATIVPILVSTEAEKKSFHQLIYDDSVYSPICCNADSLENVIRQFLLTEGGADIDGYAWGISRYSPTPTIIEAAMSLYNNHSVKEISRSDASAKNLTETCATIFDVIEKSKLEKKKSICFVTGVPGAGKTLVGLNIATQKTSDGYTAVFLSGNGPLVAILREALTRDKQKQLKVQGVKKTKKEIGSEVKAFIQNVHHFRDACLEGTLVKNGMIVPDEDYFKSELAKDKSYIPFEHIAIFDEAQRAWNKVQTQKFMKEKKGSSDFPYSEPEFLISCMDRHKDWAVIICLVGGGQEINTGEAGIGEWIKSLKRAYKHWNVFVSSRLSDAEYEAGKTFEILSNRENIHINNSLHLSVSMRSYRAENVSLFVKHLLDRDSRLAREVYVKLSKYPIVLTRDLKRAKQWLKKKARGSERFGIVVSSQAERLRPLAIDVRVSTDPVHWFLDDKEDVRSSYYLEDVATEFDVQGLELDWSCVVWDGDFRYTPDEWGAYFFKGNKWQCIRKEERRMYQKNAYRVLLTRARQGMVIVVPEGDHEDHTRKPKYYDDTYNYLKKIGIEEI